MASVLGSSSTAILASRSLTSKPSLPSLSLRNSSGFGIHGKRKGRSQFHVAVSNVATEINAVEQDEKAKESQRPVYPFAAIVGQDEMKLCLLLNVIDPR